MAYTPKVWQNNMTVYADDMNRIEQGIGKTNVWTFPGTLWAASWVVYSGTNYYNQSVSIPANLRDALPLSSVFFVCLNDPESASGVVPIQPLSDWGNVYAGQYEITQTTWSIRFFAGPMKPTMNIPIIITAMAGPQ